MQDPDDQPQSVTVSPPLDAREVELLAGLAGVVPGVRRMWPGQPGRRSPWLPCSDGCCLVLEERPQADPVGWLRFLLREVLAPRAKVARERASSLGLPGGHEVSGRVLLRRGRPPRLLVAARRQVRVREVDEELFAVDRARRRTEGEVVELGDPSEQPGQSTDR